MSKWAPPPLNCLLRSSFLDYEIIFQAILFKNLYQIICHGYNIEKVRGFPFRLKREGPKYTGS